MVRLSFPKLFRCSLAVPLLLLILIVLVGNKATNVSNVAQAGVGAVPSVYQIIDNTDPGFTTTGFLPFAGQGFQNTVHYSSPNAGNTATWTFLGLTPGTYQVSATWSVHVNRASNAPYTILNGATPLGTVLVDQQVAPNDFQDAAQGWKNLGNFTITGNTLAVRLGDTADEYVIADAVRIERVGFAGRIIDNGDTGYSATAGWTPFPGQGFQNDVDYAFTFSGSGGTETATYTFAVPVGTYRVSATWTADPNRPTNVPYTVLNGATALGTVLVNQEQVPSDFNDAGTTWRVLGDFTTTGTNNLVVRITNNGDPNQYPIADAVRVEQVANPVAILDNSSAAPAFTTTANFFPFPGQGYLNGVHYAESNTTLGTTETATWTFTGLTAGTYQVAATWTADPNRATNAPFSVLDGAAVLGTVLVNQELAPADFTDQGVGWKNLGTFTITSSTLAVRLTNVADEYVIADAIRVQRMTGGVIETEADTIRFLEQATWGPTDALIAQVRTTGFNNYLNQQFALASANYPDLPMMATDQNVGCPADPMDPNVQTLCIRMNYQQYPLQRNFFNGRYPTTASIPGTGPFGGALYGDDQLRQRMIFALHQIIVVSQIDITRPFWYVHYLRKLHANAFGNYRTLLGQIALDASMGNYLDMAGSTRVNPNENFARELLQLFTTGLNQLNDDGTPTTNPPTPVYTQATVNAYTQALTGWNFAPPAVGQAPNSTNYRDPMVSNVNNHWNGVAPQPPSPLQLLTYTGVANYGSGPGALPSGQTPLTDLNRALDNCYNHPSTAPYICRLLIQHLVTSNPSPAYTGRVVAVWRANSAGANQLREVCRAILLDPEARGDVKTDPNYGRLRHPVQQVCNILRSFNPMSADRTTGSDGYLNPNVTPQGMDVYRPATVFSYFSQDFSPVANVGFEAPEFGILSTTTALARANFVNTSIVPNSGSTNPVTTVVAATTGTPIPVAPTGTSIDLTPWRDIAALDSTGNLLVERCNRFFLHGTMSAEMRNKILQAVTTVPSSNSLRRARYALYLTLTSSQYQVQQ